MPCRSGSVGERRGAGRCRAPVERVGRAVADRDPLALGGDDERLRRRVRRCGSRSRLPCRRSRSRPAVPLGRSSRPMLETVFCRFARRCRFRAPRRRRGSPSSRPWAKTADVADRGGDLVEVDPDAASASLLNLPGGIWPGMPFSSMPSISFPEAARRIRAGRRRRRSSAGQRSEQLRGVGRGGASGRRGRWRGRSRPCSEPGTRLATAVASSGSIPVASKIGFGLRVDFAAGLFDQRRRCRRRRWRCCRRRLGDRRAEGVLVRRAIRRFGGVDHVFEGLFAFGDRRGSRR